MSTIRKTVHHISKAFYSIAQFICSLFMSFVILVLFFQVLLRVFLSKGFPWAEELARMAMIWVAMLGGGMLVKDKELISVDFLDPYLPRWFLKKRPLLISILLFAICSILSYEGYLQAVFGLGRSLSSLKVSMFWPYMAIPIGSILIIFQYVANLFENQDIHKIKTVGD